MVYQNKYIKIYVGVISIVLVVILIIYNIQKSKQPILLDEEYINSELMTPEIFIDELLLSIDVDNSNNVLCLCREADFLHIIRFEKKDNSYEFLERYQIEPTKLSEDYTESIEFSKPFITASSNKYYIYTSVFINPLSDSVFINGEEINVNKVNVKLNDKQYYIGIWAKSFLEKTNLNFETEGNTGDG